MAQTILSIDIGSYSVKVCLAERYLRDFELIQFHEQTINQSHRLTHEEGAHAALRQLLETHRLSADIISVNLPATHLSTRVLELPFTNVKKIEQTIDFELEAFIPLGLDELVTDYHILSIGETQSTVLMAYIPRLRLAKYLDMLQVVDVDPKYIGVDGIDLSHIAQIAMVPQEATYMILDVGHQKTNLCIMQGMELRYARSINVGGLHFTRAIQKAFRLNYEKAEGMKLDRGRLAMEGGGVDQISRLCQSVADELVVAIRQTYMGYRKMFPEQDWRSVYVTGGGARLPGFSEMLSAHLHLNVHTLDYIDFISHQLDSTEMTKDVMVPCLAQALRVVFASKAININFRKGEFSYRRNFKALSTEFKQLGIWFSVVLLLGTIHFFLSYQWLSDKVERADNSFVEAAMKALPELKKNKKAQTTQKIMTLLDQKIQELQPQLEVLESGTSGVGPLQLLLDISSRLPEKKDLQLDIDDFTFRGKLLKLDGRTISFDAVDQIKNALQASPFIENVNAGNVIKGIRDEYKFTLTADVVAEGEEG